MELDLSMIGIVALLVAGLATLAFLDRGVRAVRRRRVDPNGWLQQTGVSALSVDAGDPINLCQGATVDLECQAWLRCRNRCAG